MLGEIGLVPATAGIVVIVDKISHRTRLPDAVLLTGWWRGWCR